MRPVLEVALVAVAVASVIPAMVVTSSANYASIENVNFALIMHQDRVVPINVLQAVTQLKVPEIAHVTLRLIVQIRTKFACPHVIPFVILVLPEHLETTQTVLCVTQGHLGYLLLDLSSIAPTIVLQASLHQRLLAQLLVVWLQYTRKNLTHSKDHGLIIRSV